MTTDTLGVTKNTPRVIEITFGVFKITFGVSVEGEILKVTCARRHKQIEPRKYLSDFRGSIHVLFTYLYGR